MPKPYSLHLVIRVLESKGFFFISPDWKSCEVPQRRQSYAHDYRSNPWQGNPLWNFSVYFAPIKIKGRRFSRVKNKSNFRYAGTLAEIILAKNHYYYREFSILTIFRDSR